MNGPSTIAAIATAPGRAGVAIVRVSGPDALDVVRRLTGRPAEVGRMQFRRLTAADGVEIDRAVVLAFKGPHSYTGEDVAEFQCHGGTVTPRRVLEATFAAGARLARRGEFTERAFLNGRLDYDQAESVLDLIEARTDRAADAALRGLSGARARAQRDLYEAALAISTEYEHALDVDEGDLGDAFFARQESASADLRAAVSSEIEARRERRLLRDGALVVLAGAPNAGKSSLLNALLGDARAIVSDIPGTTRDSIEEGLDLDGWPVRLVDTAGLRETDDAIEGEGVRRAEDLIATADLVLELAEPTTPWRLNGPNVIRLRAKADLAPAGERRPQGVLAVSSKTGAGLDALRAELVRRVSALEPRETATGLPDDVLRGVAALLDDATAAGRDIVLRANAMRTAAERLGESIGAVYSADLLDRLFSRFCVGK